MKSTTANKAKSPKTFSWSVATRRVARPDRNSPVGLGCESGCAPSPSRVGVRKIGAAARRKAH